MRHRHCTSLGLACSFIAMMTSGCRLPQTTTPIKSPDGKLSLITSVNSSQANPVTYRCVQFTITDAHGKVLHREQTHASDRMRWSMHWQGNNKVALKSADIGTYTWQRQPTGQWKQGVNTQ